METGISPEQIAAIKEKFRKWSADPLRYRLLVAGVIAGLGYYGLVSPLASRVGQAHARLEKAEEEAKTAKAVLAMQAQTKLYADRLTVSKGSSDFEQYVIGMLRDVGLNVFTLSTRALTPMGPYHAAGLAVEAEGSYCQIIDFIDRIERGPRLARLDNLRFSRKGALLAFRCNVLGLQRAPDG